MTIEVKKERENPNQEYTRNRAEVKLRGGHNVTGNRSSCY